MPGDGTSRPLLPLLGWDRWVQDWRRRPNQRPYGRQPISMESRRVHPANFAVQSGLLVPAPKEDSPVPKGIVHLTDFLEANESIAPSTMNCSVKAGTATVPYYFKPTSDQDLRDIVPFILGGTDPSVSNSGAMSRSMPLAHPIYPTWVATNFRMKGIGLNAPNIMIATDETLTADNWPLPMPFFTLYTYYEIEIDFQSPIYPVLSDLAVGLTNGNFNLPPPSVGSVSYTSAQEWLRYVTWDSVPQNDWITGTKGASIFQTQDSNEPGGINGDATKAANFIGMPRIWLPNQLVKFTWYQVPWRFVYSPKSFLNRYLGYINQLPFFSVANNTLYPAGAILYLGYNPKPYISPVSQLQPWATGDVLGSALCDIELLFLHTNRTQKNVPNPTANPNFIASGHNLLPYYPLRDFFYTYFTGSGAATNPPYWYSFPIELLFTDPDFPGNGF